MKTFFLLLLTALGVTAADWTSSITPDAPRVYLNKAMLHEVREHIQKRCAADWKLFLKEVDALPANPELTFRKERFSIQDGKVKYQKPYAEASQIIERIGAVEAVRCALAWQVTGDKKYLAKGVAYLMMAQNFFDFCRQYKIIVDWHTESRINALIAYDWLWDGMTSQERSSVGKALLDYIAFLQPGGGANYFRCIGGAASGNYGVNNLGWFAGLAFYRRGIDDVTAEKLLRNGYKLNLDMLAYREKISGGTGLLGNATPGYSFGAYPFATFHFFHTLHSATGRKIAPDYPQMRDYPNWFDRMKIPYDGKLVTFGIGDMEHRNNMLPTYLMYQHLAQTIHFFPEKAEDCYALISSLPKSQRRFSVWFPFLPYVLTGFDPASVPARDGRADRGNHAQLMKGVGLLFSRSGNRQSDTHAVFRTGSQTAVHQHYDESSFVIFKHDFLALDGGTRTKTMHHVHYAPQSVAHNTILIHMDKEPAASFWKPWGSDAVDDLGRTVIYNHGGQYRAVGAKTLDYRATGDYTYAANDATAVYRKEKCSQAVRQFVHVLPDYFVIFDRVTSRKADQKKEYLLHTQNKPEFSANSVIRADHGKGRLFQRTFLPEKPEVSLSGGKDKEFFASGRNWPLPGGEAALAKANLYAPWRVEIRTPNDSAHAEFLHLIEAADTSVPQMVPAEKITSGDWTGIEFTARDGKVHQVMFRRTGAVEMKHSVR